MTVVVILTLTAIIGCDSPSFVSYHSPYQRLEHRLVQLDIERQNARRTGSDISSIEHESALTADTLAMVRSGALSADSLQASSTHRPGISSGLLLNIAAALSALTAVILVTAVVRIRRRVARPKQGLVTRRRMLAQTDLTAPGKNTGPTVSPGTTDTQIKQPLYRRVRTVTPPPSGPNAGSEQKSTAARAASVRAPRKQRADTKPDTPADTPLAQEHESTLATVDPIPAGKPPRKEKIRQSPTQDKSDGDSSIATVENTVDEVQKKALALHQAGNDTEQIAQTLGLSVDHVQLILRVAGK